MKKCGPFLSLTHNVLQKEKEHIQICAISLLLPTNSVKSKECIYLTQPFIDQCMCYLYIFFPFICAAFRNIILYRATYLLLFMYLLFNFFYFKQIFIFIKKKTVIRGKN